MHSDHIVNLFFIVNYECSVEEFISRTATAGENRVRYELSTQISENTRETWGPSCSHYFLNCMYYLYRESLDFSMKLG